jgi:peptide chain release factor subunit 1
VDVSYGGENGFNQAISLAEDALTNVKFVHEKKLITKFFEEIAMDTQMIVFGVKDTMKALELSAIETLVIFEELAVNRYEMKNTQTGDVRVQFLNVHQEKDPKYFKDEKSGLELDVISCMPMTEWLCEKYQDLACTIEFITDKSQEGFQFTNGFGGIGAFLRYKVELDHMIGADENRDDDFDPDEDFI